MRLREELNALKKSLERKENEYKELLTKNPQDVFRIKMCEKQKSQLAIKINDIDNKMIENGKSIHELDKELEKLKTKKAINKEMIDRKKEEITSDNNNSNKISNTNFPKNKVDKIVEKSHNFKEEDDMDEDESNSRFQYYDSGNHWCKFCRLFFSNIKQYFEHIHSKDHLKKHLESERTPWKKNNCDKVSNVINKGKDQLLIPCKGIIILYCCHFILSDTVI